MVIKLTISFLLFLCISCGKDKAPCFKGSGDIETTRRELPAFNRLIVNDRIHVEVRKDTIYRAEVIFGANLNEFIATDIENSTLILSDNNRCDFMRNLSTTPTVVLYTPMLEYVYFDGGGYLEFADTMVSSSFLFEGIGAGDVILRLQADTSRIYLYRGPSDVTVYGSANDSYSYCNGFGRANLSELRALRSYARNDATSILEVRGAHYVEAINNQLGEIIYHGTPWVLFTQNNGGGSITGVP